MSIFWILYSCLCNNKMQPFKLFSMCSLVSRFYINEKVKVSLRNYEYLMYRVIQWRLCRWTWFKMFEIYVLVIWLYYPFYCCYLKHFALLIILNHVEARYSIAWNFSIFVIFLSKHEDFSQAFIISSSGN